MIDNIIITIQIIIGIITVLFGATYRFTPKMIPYHLKFLGGDVSKIDKKYLEFYFLILKLTGVLLFICGITILTLLYFYWVNGYNWIPSLLFFIQIFGFSQVFCS